jgi:hypothetical protein
MDPFDDDDIALLLRLKRDEQPPPSYYENFLSEFRRRQRDQLLRQPLLSICLDRVQNFVLRLDVLPPGTVSGSRRGSAGVRRGRFNSDLSATRARSSHTPELAHSKPASKCRKRIEPCASGFDSEVQWESDFSSCKEEYSVAAD